MLYRDDYAKADVKVLPVVDTSGVFVAWEIVVSLILLIALSVVPLFLGIGTWITAAGNLVLGLGFLWFGVKALRSTEKMPAKHLLRASVSYLPLVFLLLFFHP